MLSNWLCLTFAMLEIFIFAGVAFGFGFMQYIFEKENVFWDDVCYDPDKHSNCTNIPDGYIVCPDDEPKIPCEAQYEEFQNIYTWFLLTSAIAPVVFEPIQRKFGTFVARSIIGTLTTVGIIILLFYEENNYLIWIAWQLLGIPTFMYLVVNIQELRAIFPAQASAFICIITGLYNASGGICLFFKITYDNLAGVTLKSMLIVYAAISAIIWIKTLCLSSYKLARVNIDQSYSVFADSPVGRLFRVDQAAETVSVTPTKVTTTDAKSSLWQYVFSMKYMIAVFFYTTVSLRAASVPGWFYPWLEWTFSVQDDEEAKENVSLMLDIYGLSYFLSIVLALLPSLMIKSSQKIFKSDVIGEQRALSILLTLSVFLSGIISLQMCFQGSLANAIMLTIFYSLFRNLFFLSKSIFLYMEFPAVHFGILYSISYLPVAATQYIIDPLFKLILNGDDLADADFVPVSIGFAILSLLSLYMPIYNHFWLGRKHLQSEAGTDDKLPNATAL